MYYIYIYTCVLSLHLSIYRDVGPGAGAPRMYIGTVVRYRSM